MVQTDMFARGEAGGGGGLLDAYETYFVDEALAPPELAEDLRGILAMRWLSQVLRWDVEEANYGARLYGTTGSFEGMVADDMPAYWRRTAQSSGGRPVWTPDAKHPIGKWFAEVVSKLLPLPPPEVLDAVLRRHGIEGSREPFPTMIEADGGWAIMVHKPKAKIRSIPGLTRREDLRALWRQPRGR